MQNNTSLKKDFNMSIYMQIKYQNKDAPDITGNAQEPSHIGWISLLNTDLGISKQIEYYPYRNSAANRNVSHPKNSTLMLKKTNCPASPLLYDLSCKTDTVRIEIH